MMEPKTITTVNSGVCGNCLSDSLTYHDNIITEDSMAYTFTCDDCGTTGKEFYDIKYESSETEVKELLANQVIPDKYSVNYNSATLNLSIYKNGELDRILSEVYINQIDTLYLEYIKEKSDEIKRNDSKVERT